MLCVMGMWIVYSFNRLAANGTSWIYHYIYSLYKVDQKMSIMIQLSIDLLFSICMAIGSSAYFCCVIQLHDFV